MGSGDFRFRLRAMRLIIKDLAAVELNAVFEFRDLDGVAMQDLWEIHSLEDVRRLWSDVCSVPGRTEGRKHDNEEWYSLGLYLLALGTHKRLTYPFKLEKGESPDFMLTCQSGETTGFEVRRATEEWLQREMKESEKEFQQREEKAKEAGAKTIPLPAQQGVLLVPSEEAKPVCKLLSEEGWRDDQAVEKWCSLICDAIDRKLTKLCNFRPASQHDLLINDDTPVPVDRQRALKALRLQVRNLTAGRQPSFRTVSLIMSLDVAYNVGGDVTLFCWRRSG